MGVFPLIPCMQCEQCIQKKYEMCQSYNYLGSRTDGAFAEYVKVPVWNLIELPENVSSEDAADNMELEKQIYWKILRRQLTIYGTWNSSFTKEEDDDWHMALRVIGEGKLCPSRQITHRFSFEELKNGLDVMRDKTVFTNKVMIS